MKRTRLLTPLRAFLFVLLLGASGFITAQTATGVPRFSSTTGGPDAINLGNLNVNLAVPVFSKPGRGKSDDLAGC